MRPITIIRALLLAVVILASASASAQLTIEITKGVEGAVPIAVVPFGGTEALPAEQDIAAIVTADLRRSGRFAPLAASAFQDRPHSMSEIDLAGWRSAKMDHVVVGQIQPSGGGYAVRFELADVFQNKQSLGLNFNVGANDLRRVAHRISDLIYEELTGERGAFSTRIAYVSATQRVGGMFTLAVADADGFAPQIILRSEQPLMSPTWSPDASQLAYVSFENRRAQIVVQDIFSGSRRVLTSEPGINGAPVWSPDGRRLALTLSRDGNPEIYTFDIGSGGFKRLTNNTAIDTEPAWSPDGQFLVFTSDRGGKPQIYRVSASGGRAERVTFEGDYNARATFSPDGRYLALVNRSGGRFRIAVLDWQSRRLSVLSQGSLDESPSFAPNGRIIMYATEQGGRGVLATVSVDGEVRQRLALRSDDVREPAWSPYSQ